MADNIKATWLKDKNGVKVAPATLTSQITDENGKGLDEILTQTIAVSGQAAVGEQVVVKKVDNNNNPIEWEYIERPCYEYKEDLINKEVWFNYFGMGKVAQYFFDSPMNFTDGAYEITVDDISWTVGYLLSGEWPFEYYIDSGNTHIRINNTTVEYFNRGSFQGLVKITKITAKTLDDKFLSSNIVRQSALNDYIKKNNYATTSAAGVVQPSTSYGTTMVNNKYIAISPASTSNISSKTDNYKPLTSKNIDYIVKEGLGDSALTWTETEKTKARNTIGVGQSDWEQNDNTKIDYIKNRTHYDYSTVYHLSQVVDYGGTIGAGDELYTPIDERLYELLVEKNVDEILVDGSQITFYEEINNQYGHKFCYKLNNEDYLYLYVSLLNKVAYVQSWSAFDGKHGTKTISYKYYERNLKQLDEKYIPDSVKPGVFVIDSEAYTYGDDALQAILSGKQLYIKVPSSSENSPYGNFMPVLQYQLPQNGNDYLTLFYLKDGIAQNLLAALATGSFDGVFGEITMMLSQSYDECPLKVDPIKQ